jgi:hypothetical protein
MHLQSLAIDPIAAVATIDIGAGGLLSGDAGDLSSSDHRDLRCTAMATWSQISRVAAT